MSQRYKDINVKDTETAIYLIHLEADRANIKVCTIEQNEFHKIRPIESVRRYVFVFQEGVPRLIDRDFAHFLMEKYGSDVLAQSDDSGKRVDDLNFMKRPALVRLYSLLRKKAEKAEKDLAGYPGVMAKTEEIEKAIRQLRQDGLDVPYKYDDETQKVVFILDDEDDDE